MRTKTIEVSEYVYDRLDSLRYVHDLSISALVEIGVDYLEKEYKWPGNKWDDFLDHTSALLQFYLHHAEVTFNEDSIKIYVDNSFAYDGIKQDMSKLKESLKSFYKKDLDVTLFLEYHD